MSIAQIIDFAIKSWGYQPKWYQIALPIVLVFLFGFYVFNRFYGPEKAAVERGFALSQRITSLQTEGFHRDRNTEIPSRPASNYFEWMSKPPARHETAGVLSIERVAAYPDHTVRLIVLVPFQDGSWAKLSARVFEPNTQIESVLARDEYQRPMKAVDDLICVGLASRRSSNSPEDLLAQNEDLAARRSRNLCRAAGVVLGRNQPTNYWAMSFGQANSAAISESDESRQRTAIIIGVRGAKPLELESLVQDLALQAPLNSIDLNAYSKSNAPTWRRMEFRWGGSTNWEPDVPAALE